MTTNLSDVQLSSEALRLLPAVAQALSLTPAAARKLRDRLWRFSAHLRQPRKDDGTCNKTPYFDRWDANTDTSHLTAEDPRYAPQAECQRVYETLMALLLEAHGIPGQPDQATALTETVLGRAFQPSSLSCRHMDQPISGDDISRALSYSTGRLGAYEIPTTYREELNDGGCHRHTNIAWMKPLHIDYDLRAALESHLRQATVPNKAVANALDKIQVKAYCTDKHTIPPHFSNRDVRWATWPDSMQYASHFECAMVEMELMVQLYEFVGAPRLDPTTLTSIERTRGRPVEPETRCCFVTGDDLAYTEYVQAATNPRGGRSAYHVGHVLPLTRGGKHCWENIAWMSEDGNRIQGNDTLEEIELKLVRAVDYHLRRDFAAAQPSQTFYQKVDVLRHLLTDIGQ